MGSSEHSYDAHGTYTISISGDIQGIRFGVRSGSRSGDEPKLISIEQWADLVWTTAHNAFLSCLIEYCNPEYIRSGTEYVLDVVHYGQGYYIVKVIGGNGKSFSKQMIVKR